jgi:hypothetical protein
MIVLLSVVALWRGTLGPHRHAIVTPASNLAAPGCPPPAAALPSLSDGHPHTIREKGTPHVRGRALPSGHDAWVVGDEPVVVVDWWGATDYARA